MRSQTAAIALTFLAAITLFDSSHGAAVKQTCIKNTNNCVRSAECCTGCCHNEKCVDFGDSCLSDQLSGAVGPCAQLDPPCPREHTCVLQPVLCVQSPCPPVASCLPPDYEDYD
ncbi:uncharacterized protein LOC124304430 [Neodiprion virginianus]|uniref:uncharacterized protein LOC124304430 n=1 Tax=Neodiprion virginianus TaxID=2961670 RepID=UPI001EE6D883|nr:uncharacterized protein LOC124304430 [Neodiprion virginianus]